MKMAAELLMDADVDLLCGAGYGERIREQGQQPQRASIPALGHQGRHDQPRDPEAAQGQLLAGRSSSPAVGPSRPCQRGLPGLRRGVSTRRVDDLVRAMGIDGMSKSQVRAGQEPRRTGGRVPQPPPRRRPLHLRLAGRPVPQGQRGRPGRQRGDGHRHGCQRRGSSRDPGLDVFTTEDGAGWTAFLRGLVARGLSGWPW